jgi:uncharacterized protein (TIGR02246 family)
MLISGNTRLDRRRTRRFTNERQSMTDPQIRGFDSLPLADQEGIGATMQALLGGFQQRDVSLMAHVYAADADWINAFGTQKKGSAEILSYLKGLFADANFDQGRMAGPPDISLRPVTPDVAIMTVHLQVLDQGLAGGGSIPVRNNFSLHVLQKQSDGSWPIVSEMFMDARTDVTYVKPDSK